MRVSEAIRHLQTLYEPEQEIAFAIWQGEDVLFRAKERGIELTPEDAENIISDIHNHLDAELGITWATLDCHIDVYNSREGAQNAK